MEQFVRKQFVRFVPRRVKDWLRYRTLSSVWGARWIHGDVDAYLRRYMPRDSRYFRWLYCLEVTRDLPGAIVELGVGPGRFLTYCATWLKATGSSKRYWGYDTFAGFPDVAEADKTGLNPQRLAMVRPGQYSFSRKRVERLAHRNGLANVTLIEGDFRQTLQTTRPDPVSFLYIDCDLYHGYKAGLELLYDRVCPGGIILFDEYEHVNEWPGAKLAVDEFFAGKPEKPTKLSFSPSYYIIRGTDATP